MCFSNRRDHFLWKTGRILFGNYREKLWKFRFQSSFQCHVAFFFFSFGKQKQVNSIGFRRKLYSLWMALAICLRFRGTAEPWGRAPKLLESTKTFFKWLLIYGGWSALNFLHTSDNCNIWLSAINQTWIWWSGEELKYRALHAKRQQCLVKLARNLEAKLSPDFRKWCVVVVHCWLPFAI